MFDSVEEVAELAAEITLSIMRQLNLPEHAERAVVRAVIEKILASAEIRKVLKKYH